MSISSVLTIINKNRIPFSVFRVKSSFLASSEKIQELEIHDKLSGKNIFVPLYRTSGNLIFSQDSSEIYQLKTFIGKNTIVIGNLRISRSTKPIDYFLQAYEKEHYSSEFFKKPSLRIDWISSEEAKELNRFTYIGKALVKFCIQRSVELGFEGRIVLKAIPSSFGFYYKLGFRPALKDLKRNDEFIKIAERLLKRARITQIPAKDLFLNLENYEQIPMILSMN